MHVCEEELNNFCVVNMDGLNHFQSLQIRIIVPVFSWFIGTFFVFFLFHVRVYI